MYRCGAEGVGQREAGHGRGLQHVLARLEVAPVGDRTRQRALDDARRVESECVGEVAGGRVRDYLDGVGQRVHARVGR